MSPEEEAATQKAMAELLRDTPFPPSHGMAIPPDMQPEPIPPHSQTITIEITNPEHEAYIKKKYGKQLEAGEPITIDEEDNKVLGVWE